MKWPPQCSGACVCFCFALAVRIGARIPHSFNIGGPDLLYSLTSGYVVGLHRCMLPILFPSPCAQGDIHIFHRVVIFVMSLLWLRGQNRSYEKALLQFVLLFRRARQTAHLHSDPSVFCRSSVDVVLLFTFISGGHLLGKPCKVIICLA